MNDAVSTTVPRNAVIYLASTNSRGRSAYATATSVRAPDRDTYQKWFTKSYEDTTRRVATTEGLFEALKNIQSKCDVTVYCNERFVDEEVVAGCIKALDNVREKHKKATGRLNVKVVKPEDESPQATYLKKITDLARWSRSTGCRLI